LPPTSIGVLPGGVITVRGLAPELKARLRVRAAHNARSMEAEARAILEAALMAAEEDTSDLATFARTLFAPLGGVDLERPPHEPLRDPPAFDASEADVSAPGRPTRATAKPKLDRGTGRPGKADHGRMRR
jgi:plasmid stability protein